LEEKGAEHQDPGEDTESIARTVVALATDLFSASILDLDTVGCFLELQEIRGTQKYTISASRLSIVRASCPNRI